MVPSGTRARGIEGQSSQRQEVWKRQHLGCGVANGIHHFGMIYQYLPYPLITAMNDVPLLAYFIRGSLKVLVRGPKQPSIIYASNPKSTALRTFPDSYSGFGYASRLPVGCFTNKLASPHFPINQVWQKWLKWNVTIGRSQWSVWNILYFHLSACPNPPRSTDCKTSEGIRSPKSKCPLRWQQCRGRSGDAPRRNDVNSWGCVGGHSIQWYTIVHGI